MLVRALQIALFIVLTGVGDLGYGHGRCGNLFVGRPSIVTPSTLSVVVPIYRELENGNFYRLIASFARQTAPISSFDLLFVVNNTPEIAADKTNSIYLENQRTTQDRAREDGYDAATRAEQLKTVSEDSRPPRHFLDPRRTLLGKYSRHGLQQCSRR